MCLDYIHQIGNSRITNSEKEKQVNEILEILKKEKQTYAVNKFVLEEAIERLGEAIF